MKKLVEFKCHAGYVPYFIESSCYLLDGPRFIGITWDDEVCYVPDTLVEVTPYEVVSRVCALPLSRHILGEEVAAYTLEEKIALAREWLASVGMEV